jgi:uncharacterized repeat protein (TIGR01451 family)
MGQWQGESVAVQEEKRANELTSSPIKSLRHPSLRVLCLIASVGALALLFALLVGSIANATQAAPSLSALLQSDPSQEGCYEPGNLAPNPSFECVGSSPSEPADWESVTYKGKPAVFYRSQLTSHSGDYSAAIASGSKATESRWQTIPIVAREGRVYEFSVWVNAENLDGKATVSLSFWSGLPDSDTLIREIFHEGTGNTPGGWVRLLTSHKAPEGTRYIRLECHLLGGGTAYFDDAAIKEYVQEPVLHLIQVDTPDPVQPGDLLSYRLTLSNTGNVTATNVVVTNTFDAQVLFTGDAIPTPEGGAGRIWYWRFPSVTVDGPHQIVMTTTVNAPLPDYTLLQNQVHWRSDQTDIQQGIEGTVVRSFPVLSIVKTDDPDPVIAGQNLIYSVVYTNSGTVSMTDILILESYPPETGFVSASPPPDNPPLNTLWLMPDLPPGQSQAVIIELSTSELADGEVLNTVLFDSNETNRVFVTETTTISITKPPFAMRFSPEQATVDAEVGQLVTQPYNLGNTGKQPLTGISVGFSRPSTWRGDMWIQPTTIASLAPGDWSPVTLFLEPAADEISGTYPVQIMAMSAKASAPAGATVLVDQHVQVQAEPDYMHYASPGVTITSTHQITNLGNYTDTILVLVKPRIPWPVSPTSVSLDHVGIGQMRPFTLVITVPDTAQINIENQVTISAISAIRPSEDELAFDIVFVRPWQMFLPLVMKPYVPPDPFCNGDFAQELESCWTYTVVPSVERICSSGSCFVRMARAEDDELCAGDLTPGTAVLRQAFTPTETGEATLRFEYEIHTQDVLSDLYDTLKVFIDNQQVFMVTEGNLNYGCDSPSMVVSGMAEIPISVVRDKQIALKFHLINSDTYFNTYADIRNVQIVY